MTEYVFDAEPLVALRYDEEGAERVEEILEDVYDGDSTAAMSVVTATELRYVIGRAEGDIRTGVRTVRDHVDGGVELVPVRSHGLTAARVKMDGNISLGDSFSAALAHEEDVKLVVGKDEEFDSLPVEVTLERI
jgi:uncharacterized protein with PIN domain